MRRPRPGHCRRGADLPQPRGVKLNPANRPSVEIEPGHSLHALPVRLFFCSATSHGVRPASQVLRRPLECSRALPGDPGRFSRIAVCACMNRFGLGSHGAWRSSRETRVGPTLDQPAQGRDQFNTAHSLVRRRAVYGRTRQSDVGGAPTQRPRMNAYPIR